MHPRLQPESEPSHRAGHHAAPPPGAGFGDDGELIAVVEADHDDAEPASIRAQGEIVYRLLSALIVGASDVRHIGERAILMAAAFRFPFAPARTSRELGEWLGCSHVTASKKLATLSKDFPAIIESFERSLTNAGLGEGTNAPPKI